MRAVHLGIGIVPVPPGDRAAGREEYIYQLTYHLGRMGCQVDVIDIKGGDQQRERRQRSSAKFHELWHPPLPPRYNFPFLRRYIHYLLMAVQTYLFALLSSFKLYTLLGRERIDVIHTHDRDVALAAGSVNKLRGKGAVLLYTPQGAFGFGRLPWYRKYLIDVAEMLAMRLADHLVALTPAARDWLIAEYALPPEKVTQIYVGTAVDEIEQFLATSEVPCHQSHMVLCVGVISKRKNQLTAVKAISRVVTTVPDVKLVFAGVIGDNDYFGVIERFITEKNLSQWVEFRGEVTKDELHGLYRDAAVLLFPTTAEVQPTVLMEALGFGLPVVASNIGSISDVVSRREGSAILVDPYEVEGMASAIIRLFEDGPLRQSMSQRAKEVAQTLSYRGVAAQTLALYNRLVAESDATGVSKE